MVELLSYFTEDDILEFSEFDDSKVNKALVKHCLKEYDEATQEKGIKLLGVKKNGKNIDLKKGFALTHIRFDGVEDIKMAIGLFGKMANFGKQSNVQALFCIIIPEYKCQTYLSLMAHLTRMLSSQGAKEIFRPGNKKGIIKFIREFEER